MHNNIFDEASTRKLDTLQHLLTADGAEQQLLVIGSLFKDSVAASHYTWLNRCTRHGALKQ